MFKKEFQSKASANIKSSERRKLFSSICDTYDLPQSQLTKEAELDLLPVTIKQSTYESEQGHKGTIYLDENETPLWFKTRDSECYPSIFTLWKAAYVLPVIKTHPHVFKVLVNGANLMLPGTIPPFDKRAVKGKLVGIVESEHPTVIKAIGVCNLNMTQFTSVIGRTGIAVQVLHNVGDFLYKMNKYVDIPVPEVVINEIPLKEEQLEDQPTDTPVDTDKDQPTDTPTDTIQTTDIDQPTDTPIDMDQPTDTPIETVSNTEVASRNSISDVAEELSELSVEDVDNFFVKSLLQTIKTDGIKPPITSSTFMSNHIYNNLPVISPTYCNIKKTSWKKTAKFLKAMEKQKYLTVKGKGDDLTITGLMEASNPLLVNFVIHKTMGAVRAKANTEASQKKNKNELQVTKLFKPTAKSRSFFNKIDEIYDCYYTAQEVRKLLELYIKFEKLVNPSNPKNVDLDNVLHSITQLKNEPQPRDVVYKSFLKNFSPYYTILKRGEEIDEDTLIKKGEPPVIKILSQTKIGRKIVTSVRNFEDFGIKPHILSEELKVKCSGSTTIGPCVQNPSLIEVSVQGPHGKIIIDLLNEKGVPSTYIDFEDKVKKKKKRT